MAAFQLTDVPPEKLQQTLQDFAREGFDCVVTQQADGSFTVTAQLKQGAGSADAGGPPAARSSSNEGSDGASGANPASFTASAGNGFVANSIQVALAEWDFFGRQEYNLAGNAVQAGHKEAEPGFRERIGRYWTEGVDRPGLDGASDAPWSAAFMSWVMKKAGAGSRFRYSSQHSIFISQGILDGLARREDAGFWGRQLNERKPAPGDLVCWARQAGIDFDHQNNGDYKGHSDLVVQVDSDRVWVVGGNVGNSVTRRPLAISSAGFLDPAVVSGESLFGILQCRIGTAATDVAAGPSGGPAPQALVSLQDNDVPPSNAAGSVEIAWGKAVSPEFKATVIKISNMLGCDPSHLMSAMAFETGAKFSAKVRNPQSQATGLVQFTKSTALSLGTTIDELAAMTEVDQLDFVLRYLLPFRNRMLNLSDLYMAILAPVAVGRPDASMLYARPSEAYEQNRGLDANQDGQITKGEAAAKVQAALVQGLAADFRG